MSVVTGGDILEVSFDNPDVGAGFFFPVAEKDSTINAGGFRNNDQLQMDGAGRLITAKNRMPGGFQMEVASDEVNTREHQNATLLAASTSPTIWTVQHVNGTIYKGEGVIQGPIELNGNTSSFTLKVACATLTPQ